MKKLVWIGAVIQRTIDVSPASVWHGSAEKIAVWAHTNRDPKKQEVEFIFARSGSELWTLIKYSRSKIKNKKPIAVDVLFNAYPMVPLSCRSNLAWRYTFKPREICNWSKDDVLVIPRIPTRQNAQAWFENNLPSDLRTGDKKNFRTFFYRGQFYLLKYWGTVYGKRNENKGGYEKRGNIETR